MRKDVKFNGVKVFSATMVADRDQLGEKVTAWIAGNKDKKVTPTGMSPAEAERIANALDRALDDDD